MMAIYIGQHLIEIGSVKVAIAAPLPAITLKPSITDGTRGWIDRATGEQIKSERADIYQSIKTILTTPVGSRVMQRAFGSLLPGLLSKPINRENIILIYSAVNEAVARWEPRVSILQTTVAFDKIAQGTIAINITVQVPGGTETYEYEFT